MQKAKTSFSVQFIGVFFILFCCGVSTSVAVEAPGSPFVATVTTNTARTYTGTVVAGQNTLVAYERDIFIGSSDCSAYNTAVSDFGLTTQPTQGTVDVSGASLPGIPYQAWEEPSCGGASFPWTTPDDARAIYYRADATATGSDSFTITLPNGDTITVNITIATESAGIATITPVLLQTSVKQTTSMISARVKRVIIPQAMFKERLNDEAKIDNNRRILFEANQTAGQELPREKQGLSDLIAVSIDQQTIGLSAGDASMRHGIWTNIAYTATDDDTAVTESEMDINTYIIGYDYKLSERMAIGVAVTYEQVDADLDFNNGELDGDGYTVAPYFAMLLTDYLALDVIAGYAIIDYDQDRDFGAVTSSVDADRQFFELSLNGFHYIDQWSLNVNLSFLYAHEGQDSYTESDGTKIKSNNVDFSQLSIGTEVAYSFKYVEPYVTLAYERDTQYEEISGTSYDKSGGDGGIGCRLFFSNQLSGDFYGSTKFGRDDYDEYSVLGNLRYDF